MTDNERLRLLQLKKRQLELGKSGSLPEDVINEPGLQNVSMTPVTKPDLEQAGVDIAESKFGQKNPIAGATLGTAVAKADDIAAAVSGIRAAPAMAQGIKSTGKLAISKLQTLADTIMGPGEKAATLAAEQMTAPARQVTQEVATALKGASNPTPELLATQERQAALGAQFGEKQAQLTEMKKTAGQAIGQVEKEAGLEFKTLPENFQKMLRNKELLGKKANAMARLSDKGSDFIAQNLDKTTIQANRKLAQEALKMPGLDDLTRVQLAKANSTLGNALGEQIPQLKEKLSAFKEIDQALKDLPRAKKAEGDALRLSLRRITNEIKTGKMTLQAKQQMAQEALDNISRDAEVLIQQGKRRDIVRSRLFKGAVGAALAGVGPSAVRKLVGQ